jgi:hypothetical protein
MMMRFGAEMKAKENGFMKPLKSRRKNLRGAGSGNHRPDDDAAGTVCYNALV